jgi:hypothetical protein
MRLTVDAKNTKVFDDVLTEEEFQTLFDYYNRIPLVFKQVQGEWNKVWSLSDGNILVGREILFPIGKTPPLHPEDSAMIPMIEKISELLLSTGFFNLDEIGGAIMTPFCWPPGTGLSWHNDSNYTGAFTFYTHNYWSPEWGGEFLTVEADDYIIDNKKDINWKVFDNQELYDVIMEKGIGHFFHPKPNRLIVNRGGERGILHKVSKSTIDSRARLTFQGFIK